MTSLYLLVATGVMISAALYVKRRARQLHHAGELRDRFYATANRLFDDEHVSDDVVDFVVFLSRSMTSRTVIWRLAFDLLTGRVDRIMRNAEARQRFERMMKSLTPKNRVAFLEAIVFYTIAITFNNAWIGSVVRRIVMSDIRINSHPNGQNNDVVSGAEKATAIVDDIARHGQHRLAAA